MLSNFSSKRGGSLVELAVLMPFYWILISSAFQFASAFYVYSRLVESVSNATRYASRVDFDEPSHTFVSAVQNVAVCGSPSPCTRPGVAGFTTANANVSWTRDSAGVPATITTCVDAFSYSVLLRRFTWSGKPCVTAQYVGVYKP